MEKMCLMSEDIKLNGPIFLSLLEINIKSVHLFLCVLQSIDSCICKVIWFACDPTEWKNTGVRLLCVGLQVLLIGDEDDATVCSEEEEHIQTEGEIRKCMDV